MRQLRRLLDRLGIPGVLGLGVLLACAAFFLTAVQPAENELEAQRASAARLKSRVPYQPVTSAGTAAAELWRFHNLFPGVNELADQLEAVYALARAARLELHQGEYRLEAPGPGLAAYRITLPLRGTYPQVREFVSGVLEKMPVVSVDAVRFERKKVGDAQLEAQVRLTLYLRPPAGVDQ